MDKSTNLNEEEWPSNLDKLIIVIVISGLFFYKNIFSKYFLFAHDVISCHWAPSWLILQITLVIYSEVVASI